MTWKWIGRLFPPAEREPRWMDADARLARSDLLLDLLYDVGNSPLAAPAAERLRAEAAAMRPAEWVRIDEVLRRRMAGWSEIVAPRWVHGPDDVRRLVPTPGTEAAVFGFLATHHSGFVREACVQRLALLGGGDELAPLLMRATDWVPQVRARALDALQARVVPEYAESWVRWIPLVLRLRTTGRTCARPLVAAVLELLRRPAAWDALWKGLESPESAVARASFRLMRERGDMVPARTVTAAARLRDPVIRREAVQAAAGLNDGALNHVLPALVADPEPRVRREALALAAERMGPVALPWLRRALLDRSAGVRAEARGALRRLEPADFAAFYRERVLAADARLAEAVGGLADTGGTRDADIVRPLLAHPRPRVRGAAVRALAALAGSRAAPALLAAVADESRRVSHAAMAALRRLPGQVDAGALAESFLSPGPAHVRRNALGLLIASGKWEGLMWILRALDDEDEVVRQHAGLYLRRWMDRANVVQTLPTPDQLRRLAAAIDQAPSLDDGMRDRLRFVAALPREPVAKPGFR